jgi:hypothetical protein
MKMRLIALVFSLILVEFATFAATPADAQGIRTFVSGVGDDANPCSRTAPCKTFAGAISKTLPAGEINVLDPGSFGAVTITKSITIRADHVEAGVLVSGANGITVAAGATDTVVLEGLDLDGANSGLNGVNIVSGFRVFIIRCAIRRFTQNGVNVTSNSTGARAFIRDSLIYLNGTFSTTPTGGGVNVQGSGVGNIVSIANTEIDANGSYAIQASGMGNIIGVANSILNASPIGISLLNMASADSFGPSNIVAGTGTFTSTIDFK